MKKVLIALLVITSLTVSAQESVLLRLNYTKGDSFLVTTESKQSMGAQGGMNMKMTMGMIVTEVAEENIKTESMITSVNLEMMQGGMTMSYDSSKKEEELDQATLDLVPPIKAIFFVKFSIAKLCCRVPSIEASAIKPGALITVHSGKKSTNSLVVGLKNIL